MDGSSSSAGAAPGSGALFCNGLRAADDFLKRWTHAQQQQLQQQQQHQQQQQQQQQVQLPPPEEQCGDAEADEGSGPELYPFEALCSEQLQAAAHMVAQVPPLTCTLLPLPSKP